MWGWPWARRAPQILGFPYNISATAVASDIKFGAQLGFAKAHHKITRRRKDGRGPGLGELAKIWEFPSIFTQLLKLATSNLVYSLGFPRSIIKSHPFEKVVMALGLESSAKILWFPFNIYTMAEVIHFKFGTQLGFSNAHHKPHPEEKWAWPSVREASIYLGFPLILLQRSRCPFSVSGASCLRHVI